MKSYILSALRKLQTKSIVFRSKTIKSIGRDVHVGARSKIWAPVGVCIGSHVYIGKDVHIEANCRIGNFCLLANRVSIIGRHDHDFFKIGFPVRYSPWICSKKFPSRYIDEHAIIEDEVWLGFGVIVLTGVTIGRGSIVAAGSVVSSDIPEYSIAAGVPAKVIKKRFSSDQIEEHERAIAQGEFKLSERGYDFCDIRPNF
jgi:acetyltransferase-like isoleucine patch superfamily enzyme